MKKDLGTRIIMPVVLLVPLTSVDAAVPDASGIIHACYNPSGIVRIIDVELGDACQGNDTAVQWSAVVSQGCPAGTAPALGVCYETESREPADLIDASDICAAAGRRLPSGGELRSIREIPGVTLDSQGEWTDDLGDVNVEATFVYSIFSDTGSFVNSAFGTFRYRCIAGQTLN
jgi:hypothetical protein